MTNRDGTRWEDLERVAPDTLDPATMNARELRRLPGVGASRAQSILKARERHAGRLARGERPDPLCPDSMYPDPMHWEDVHGIGPKTAARIRRWLSARGTDPHRPLSARDRTAAGGFGEDL